MTVRTLDRTKFCQDNYWVQLVSNVRLRQLGLLVALFALRLLVGCSITSQSPEGTAGTVKLAVSPATMNFGTVAVGNNASLPGTLTAGSSNITVSSAALNGQGYSVSGINFPVMVPAGQSVPFTVTFVPQTTGASSGSVTFYSNAPNSPSAETLTGTGTQASQHSVDLSWNASATQVLGYNLYRGTQSGGPYGLLNSSLLASTSYTDASVQSGATYFYVATAVNLNNLESAYSNQVEAVIPSP